MVDFQSTLIRPEVFILGWFLGALALSWGLSLLFRASRLYGNSKQPKLSNRNSEAFYIRLLYRIPEKSGRNLRRLFGQSPDVRSIYLRSEFLLTFAASLQPDDILETWYHAPAFRDERRAYAEALAQSHLNTVQQIKSGHIDHIYRPPIDRPERPFAVQFPQLPSEFWIFISQKFDASPGKMRGMMMEGAYFVRVVEWQDKDGYAEKLTVTNVRGEAFDVEQSVLINALRQKKLAILSVCFAGLAIFIFAPKSHAFKRTWPEQKVSGVLPLQPVAYTDFDKLNKRFLILLGGANPINFTRISWFYHPERGIIPNAQLFQTLSARGLKTSLSKVMGIMKVPLSWIHTALFSNMRS